MIEGKCPSCGAPISFTAGSAQVRVCPHCRTVVARSGPALESRGQVAAIVDTGSPLQLGTTGRFKDKPFRVVGRLQKDWGRGPWDEWCVEFDDRSNGWLSESEGTWHLMVRAGIEKDLLYNSLVPALKVELLGRNYVIEEVGTSRTVAAEGELPNEVDPTETGRYADFTGPGGSFGTLDFGTQNDQPEIFVGLKVPLETLALSSESPKPKAKKVELLGARCTQCNGALELRAPDQTKRVGCPYCGALLDVSKGKLKFLAALGKPKFEVEIPLGAKGELRGVEWTCIAFLRRSCEVEETHYPWDEYLLFNRGRGFAWLVQSNGHWVILEPVAAGDISEAGRALSFAGRSYRAFGTVEAVTEYVLGECYWEVRQGETSQASEYVSPPYVVSRELSAQEVTFTAGEYLDPKALEWAFGIKLPSRPSGVAPAQPNPHRQRLSADLPYAFGYSVAIVLLFIVASMLSANERVLTQKVDLSAAMASGTPEAMHFSDPFEIKSSGNLRARFTGGPLDQDWLAIEGDLVNEETSEVTSFSTELSYYSGVDSDGSWSEGRTETSEYVSRLPPGRYVLRTTAHFGRAAARSYTVALTSDSPRGLWALLALLALSLWPLTTFMRSSTFETQRWNESNLS